MAWRENEQQAVDSIRLIIGFVFFFLFKKKCSKRKQSGWYVWVSFYVAFYLICWAYANPHCIVVYKSDQLLGLKSITKH